MKTNTSPSKILPPSAVRRTGRQVSTLGQLLPSQRSALIRWLNQDRLSYAVIQRRLQDRFGVRISISALSVFWQRLAARPMPETVLLDFLVIPAPQRLARPGLSPFPRR